MTVMIKRAFSMITPKRAGGKPRCMQVLGKILQDKVTVLAEEWPEEIDENRAKAALERISNAMN